MKQLKTQKEQLQYHVIYLYPRGRAYYAEGEKISVDSFHTEIPEGIIGYEIRYGIGCRWYRSYSVYRGEVISLQEAKEALGEHFSDLTEEMAKAGKTKQELEKEYLEKADLKKRFDKFLCECEEMEILENYEEKKAPVGVVIMEETRYPQYLYEGDVVISLN